MEHGRSAPVVSRATRALGWSFANMAVSRLSTLAIGIILARVLGPDNFGTFAVAFVALLAILSFNELGVSLAIVRWPGDPREIAPTVATVAVGSSVIIYVGCFFGAPLFASAMGAPDATAVVRVLTLNVIINGIVSVPAATLQREFRQGRKMIADQVTTWTSSLVSVGCAFAGLGAMSLAYGQLIGAVCGGALLIAFAHGSVRLGFDPAKARALLRFGLPLAGSSIVVFAATNVDKIIVGAALGPIALGFYVLAMNLSNWPVTAFSQPVRAVAPAALSRLQHDAPAMRKMFLSAVGFLAAVTLPACVVLAVIADPLIRLVYGSVWLPSAPVLTWLALFGVLRILFELSYDYFVVLARSRVVFTAQVVWLLALLPALWFGGRAGGVTGVALAQLLVALVVVAPLYLWELSRAGIAPGAIWRHLLLPCVGGLAAAAAVLVAVRTIHVDIIALLVAGSLGAAVIGVLGYRMRGDLRELRTLEPAS